MNRAQGNGRAKPDGFLHLNNYSHVRQSGLAGVLYERLMTEKQQELVELTLLELSNDWAQRNAPEFTPVPKDYAAPYKHDVWRFKKSFLKDHFIHVVYSVFRSVRKSAAQEVSMAISREELQSESRKVIQPSFR